MSHNHYSYFTSIDSPALADSDVDSQSTGSVGDDEADEHSTESDHQEYSFHGKALSDVKSYGETTIPDDTSFTLFCDLLSMLDQEILCDNEDKGESVYSSSRLDCQDICGQETLESVNNIKDKTRPMIMNRQAAVRWRKNSLVYTMNLDTCTSSSRLFNDKHCSIDNATTLYYDSDPNAKRAHCYEDTDKIVSDNYLEPLPVAESHDCHSEMNFNNIPCSYSSLEMKSDVSDEIINVGAKINFMMSFLLVEVAYRTYFSFYRNSCMDAYA